MRIKSIQIEKTDIISFIVILILSFSITLFSLAKGFTYEFAFITNIFIAILSPFYFKNKNSTLLKAMVLLIVFPVVQIIMVKDLCNISSGILFFILMPTTSLILIYFVMKLLKISKKCIIIKYFIIISLSLILDLYLIYSQPHIFIYNSFWGYFQGSLYDNSIKITDALIYLSIFKLINSSILFLYIKTFNKKNISIKEYILLSILILSSISIFIFQDELGLKSSKEYLQKELGGYIQTEHFDIYYPIDYDNKKMNMLVKEHEFYIKELEKHFKIDWSENNKINSYIFKNSKDKKKLMGAGNTLIAKVWLKSIFINYQSFPHQSLKHEIAHVVLSKFSNRFLKIPMKYGIYPQTGIIEGMAVVVEDKETTLSLDEKMAILKFQKRFPPIEKMVSPTGFFKYNSHYAYQTLGAFINFLTNKYGVEKVEKLYQKESFKKAFNKDVITLKNEYLKYLEKIKIPKRYIPKTEKNFFRKSIFKEVCPHDIRDMKKEINELFKKAKTNIKFKKLALEKIDNLIDLNPNDLGFYFFILRSSKLNGFLDIATEYLKKIEKFKLSKYEKNNYLDIKANILWLQNNELEAQEIYKKLLNNDLSDSNFRSIYIKYKSLELCSKNELCELKKLVFDYIIKRDRIKAYIVRFDLETTQLKNQDKTNILSQIKNENINTNILSQIELEQQSIINYLYGRYYYNRSHHEEVIYFLMKKTDLPYPIKVEKYKMLIKTYFLINQRKKSIKFAKELIKFAQTEGLKNFAKRYILFNKEF